VSIYQVTTTASAVYDSPVGHDVILYNIGPNTVYASKWQSVSLTEGFPILSGNSAVWDGEKPLYIYTATGGATFVVDANIKNVFDISTLASAITFLLTGGTQLNNTGIAAAINAAGVPMANNMSGNYSNSATMASGGQTAIFINPGNALSFQLYVGGSIATSSATDLSISTVRITWYRDAGYTQGLSVDDYQFHSQSITAAGGALLIRGACLSPYAIMTYMNGSPYSMTFNASMTTFTREIKPLVYREQYNMAPGSAINEDASYQSGMSTFWNVTLTNGVINLVYPSFRVGHAIMNVTLNTTITTGPVTISIQDGSNGQIICEQKLLASTVLNSTIVMPFYFPNRPMRVLAVSNNVANIGVFVSITQDLSQR